MAGTRPPRRADAAHTESAGAYRLAAKGWRLRKTAQSDIRAILPKVMLLHYVRAQPIAEGDLEISMPAEEDALMSLEEDRTFHGAPSAAPFESAKARDRRRHVLEWRRLAAGTARRDLDSHRRACTVASGLKGREPGSGGGKGMMAATQLAH